MFLKQNSFLDEERHPRTSILPDFLVLFKTSKERNTSNNDLKETKIISTKSPHLTPGT